MNRLIFILAFVLATLTGVAQVNVSGVIVEEGSNEPLTGASVILRNAEGKIKKYATSDAKGKFSISTPDIKGYTLDVSMMSFAKQTVKLDSVQLPVTIVMEASATMLKEVAVKADRIREQGDTITYTVGTFAQAQDRSIGDVLKRMPGIDVSNSGKIQYQGEDINKFYIEGSDLLGGKYGIATNGINHDDVGAVEVMENHQPMQVLSGISFSDKAAINLKLKNKAKATWTFHGDAGGGYSWQPEGAAWDGELFAMAVMPGFQNITTFKTNNIGEDLSASATDFFASSRATGLSQYVSVSLPGVPNLSRKRTLFNRSALVSTNSLWKVKISASFAYKHTRRGVFANAMVMQSWSHLPYTMAQQLYGDYIVYSYTDAKSDGQNLLAMGSVGKTLDFMRGSANVNGSFNRGESHLFSENNAVNSVSLGWSVGAKINGAPLRWLSLDYHIDFSNSQLRMNGVKNSWLSSMENSLLINIMPHSKWEWRIMGEHYRNELTEGTYKNVFLLDTKLVYKLNKRIELSAMLNNIFNQRTYNYTTYSQLSSFESQRWLRGRELLFTISLRK